ncbi:MAG TPA: hypothetical protein PLJ21_08200 [Pseudobdellovibrionaceae bacterium]|nr:hypothetical protein [Pseudobdellovibrionaceae bacterium]
MKIQNQSIFLFLISFYQTLFALPEFPIHVQILNFGGTSHYQATETILSPSGSGNRYKTKNVSSAQRLGTCSSFFKSFQDHPLNIMKDNGYISAATLAQLQNQLPQQINARQLELFTAFSEIPKATVDELVRSGQISKDRIMGHTIGNPDLINVSRGTIYAVRGHILNLDPSQNITLIPQTLPWELGLSSPSNHNTIKPIDREKIKYLVEIGRAHTESGVLPGNLKLLIQMLFSTLNIEALKLKADPSEFLITAHFLDPQHVRYFTTQFPLRPLTPDLQVLLEKDPTETLSTYLSLPLPKGAKAWSNYKDIIAFGTLKAFTNSFDVTDISENAYRFSKLTGGLFDGYIGLDLLSEFPLLLRDDFYYTLPKDLGGTVTPFPIRIIDGGSTLGSVKANGLFKRFGIKLDTPLFKAAKSIFESNTINPLPDLFMGGWNEKNIFFDENFGGSSNLFYQGLLISNLDLKLTTQYPIRYVTSVMLSVFDWIQQRISGARNNGVSTENYHILLKYTNEHRVKNRLKPLSEITVDSFLESFPLAVGTKDRLLIEQLKTLGGKTQKAKLISGDFNDTPHKMSLSLNFSESEIFTFDALTLKEISKNFPEYLQQAKKRLQSSNLMTQQKLLQSGMK